MSSQKLTPQEFDAHQAAGTLRLAFVGMSNAGKSYRSQVLAEGHDFAWYCVDEEIQKALGFETMAEISSWMGYPSSDGYKEREVEYLRLEVAATDHASMKTEGKNLVFDTTGSVVHLPSKTLDILKDNCLVVHLQIDEASMGEMVEQFFLKPKPVAWGEFFTTESGESEEEALKRCYPLLLKERLSRYKKLAHIHVPVTELYDTSGEETLSIIKRHL